MMENGLISSAKETPPPTQNELDKTTKGSTKQSSKQNHQNYQNSVTSFHSNNVVSSPSASEQNSQISSPSVSTSVDKPGKH